MIATVFLTLSSLSAQESDTSRPNILFIHVDQLHWQAMAAYGNKYVKIPAMGRIVADGISFRASYSANPVCRPARAC